MFGTGVYLEQLKSNAEKLGVEERVLFLGYNKDAMFYSSQFDVMVMPSYSEGFPLALFEVVQLKAPVVCSNIPVLQEIFKPNEVARFELNNIDAFYVAIKKAIENKAEFTNNALKRFEENYSPAIVSNKYLELYQELI